ncbi:uncharacterized protein EV420DRAFT_1641529 [Desarmillaria tabescens]|uniref:Uncharacterized protein n=1 Tax=Armillaria tabescens TaxID=1929756 RepID=A0AA39N6Q0_ARMTA|nr:uncharacterized protein EV420DRAFT_1641529 [Desarmillaria tabescens]KAK0460201.1 hypothetical protein EV420DRAFT_1641529 [Desarmillaria tabescens]
MQKVSLEDDGTGHVWHILKSTNEGKEAKEVVFTANGIICSLDLPPLFKVPKSLSDKPSMLSQKITITGLGSRYFEEAMEEPKEVSLTAEREFKQEALKQWRPTTYHSFDAMESTN